MARTVKRTFGVSAVGILMTVMMEVTIAVGYLIRKTLVHIWKYKYKQSFSLRFGPVFDWFRQQWQNKANKIAQEAHSQHAAKDSPTNTYDSIPWVTMVTCTIEWTLGIGTVRVSVTIIFIRGAFFNIWNAIISLHCLSFIYPALRQIKISFIALTQTSRTRILSIWWAFAFDFVFCSNWSYSF